MRKWAVTVAFAAGVCGALVAPAPARDLTVRISTAASSVEGAPCRVRVSLSRLIPSTVLLQERDGRRWRTVARKRLLRRPITLRCPTGRAGRTRSFRALVRRGDRIIGRSPVVRTHVAARPSAPPAEAPPPAPAPPAAPDPAPSRPALDPAQFGVEGTGGPPSAETLALLSNPNAVFNSVGVADLQAGRIDPRIGAVLTKLAQAHAVTVRAMCSDHPKFTAGGSVSLHYLGRGVDIAAIDGAPVNASNPTARDVALGLASLDASYRPGEIGTPCAIAGPGYFTDASTQDDLHIAFERPIDPAWTPATT